MERPTSTVSFDTPGRFVWIYGKGWATKVEFKGRFWVAVELDEFGGFRRRLHDGRS